MTRSWPFPDFTKRRKVSAARPDVPRVTLRMPGYGSKDEALALQALLALLEKRMAGRGRLPGRQSLRATRERILQRQAQLQAQRGARA